MDERDVQAKPHFITRDEDPKFFEFEVDNCSQIEGLSLKSEGTNTMSNSLNSPGSSGKLPKRKSFIQDYEFFSTQHEETTTGLESVP